MSIVARKHGSPERAVQRTLVRWLRLVLPPGAIVAAIANEEKARSASAASRGRFGAARRASGVVTGVPDLFAALPGGKVVWVEVKAPANGVLSDAQDGLHNRLRTLGHQVIVATSVETARGSLQALGIPLREAAGQATATARVRVARPRKRLLNDPVPL